MMAGPSMPLIASVSQSDRRCVVIEHALILERAVLDDGDRAAGIDAGIEKFRRNIAGAI